MTDLAGQEVQVAEGGLAKDSESVFLFNVFALCILCALQCAAADCAVIVSLSDNSKIQPCGRCCGSKSMQQSRMGWRRGSMAHTVCISYVCSVLLDMLCSRVWRCYWFYQSVTCLCALLSMAAASAMLFFYNSSINTCVYLA